MGSWSSLSSLLCAIRMPLFFARGHPERLEGKQGFREALAAPAPRLCVGARGGAAACALHTAHAAAAGRAHASTALGRDPTGGWLFYFLLVPVPDGNQRTFPTASSALGPQDERDCAGRHLKPRFPLRTWNGTRSLRTPAQSSLQPRQPGPWAPSAQGRQTEGRGPGGAVSGGVSAFSQVPGSTALP